MTTVNCSQMSRNESHFSRLWLTLICPGTNTEKHTHSAGKRGKSRGWKRKRKRKKKKPIISRPRSWICHREEAGPDTGAITQAVNISAALEPDPSAAVVSTLASSSSTSSSPFLFLLLVSSFSLFLQELSSRISYPAVSWFLTFLPSFSFSHRLFNKRFVSFSAPFWWASHTFSIVSIDCCIIHCFVISNGLSNSITWISLIDLFHWFELMNFLNLFQLEISDRATYALRFS